MAPSTPKSNRPGVAFLLIPLRGLRVPLSVSTSLPSLGPEPHDAPLLKGKSREAGQTTAAMSTSLPTSAPHLEVSTKDALNRVSTVYQLFALRWARLGASCPKHKEPVVNRGRHHDPALVDTCLQSTNFSGRRGGF